LNENTKWAWQPQPGPQTVLIDCPYREVLFGGARGGGKSDGVLGKWAIKAGLFGKGFNAVFFRPEMPGTDDLWSRASEVYGKLKARPSDAKKTIVFPGGGSVRFRPLENERDAGKYQGQNLSDVCIEEAGLYPTSKPIDMMFGALRSAEGVPVQMILTANPGGPGQSWMKERYIDPAPAGMVPLIRKLPNGAQHKYIYIPSKVTDNKILLKNDPGYVDRLYLVGSPALVKAWLDGDWGAIEGAFFPEFALQRHVIPFAHLPAWWQRFRAMDWGSAKPFCVQWYAVATDDWLHPATGYLIPRGALICYRELYGASGPNIGVKMPADQVARKIKELEEREKVNQDASVCDPACFNSDGGPSIAERFMQQNVFFRRADNSRVPKGGHMGGWDALRARLVGDEDERPMIYWMDHCKALIRTLPMMQHDKTNAEDLDTKAEDHAVDTARYACMSRPYRRTKPLTAEQSLSVAWTHNDMHERRDRPAQGNRN
jgi:hypothetical protein